MEHKIRIVRPEELEALRTRYPVGTRVELLQMNDVQAPPIGTKGTVTGIDDTGSILVNWDNGSDLCVLYGIDHIREHTYSLASEADAARQSATALTADTPSREQGREPR